MGPGRQRVDLAKLVVSPAAALRVSLTRRKLRTGWRDHMTENQFKTPRKKNCTACMHMQCRVGACQITDYNIVYIIGKSYRVCLYKNEAFKLNINSHIIFKKRF